MTFRKVLIVFFIFTFSIISFAETRNARRAAERSESTNPSLEALPDWEQKTLYYGEWDSSLTWFWTIPNDDGDIYYNMRFSPNGAWRLLGINFALFDLFGDHGTPDISVLIWDAGEDGIPGELIDSVSYAYNELQFSSVESGDIEVVLNSKDVSELQIGNNDPNGREFHIGVNAGPNNSEEDTLTLLSDDGGILETDRGSLYNPVEDFWYKMVWLRYDTSGHGDIIDSIGFNFAFQAVLEVFNSAPIFMDPATNLPQIVSLESVAPNPFNDHARIGFSVQHGVPYAAVLVDIYGRQVKVVATGIGTGHDVMNLSGLGLPAGTYYLQLTAAGTQARRSIVYLK